MKYLNLHRSLISIFHASWHDWCPCQWPHLPPKQGATHSLLLGADPGLWQHLICAQSFSCLRLKPQHRSSRDVGFGQHVSLLGNIPSMTLPISLDIVNDYSWHEKSCCRSCSIRRFWAEAQCIWCHCAGGVWDQLWEPQLVVCIEILPACLTRAAVLAKVEE